jgi:phage virion morphogenesis protein
MPGISVTYDSTAVKEALKALSTKVSDLKPALMNIGRKVLTQTQFRFRNQVDPDGKPWEKNKRGGQILRDTGRLQNSLFWGNLTDASVDVGTNVVYAAMMQFGAKKGQFGRKTVVANVKAHQVRNFMGRGKTVQVQAHTRNQSVIIPWGDIPPRPFLGINEADQAEIISIISTHVAK